MTIKKSHETGGMIAQCDKCFDVVDFDELDGSHSDHWSDVREAIAKDGWVTKRNGDKWINVCVDCV